MKNVMPHLIKGSNRGHILKTQYVIKQYEFVIMTPKKKINGPTEHILRQYV